MKFPSVIGLSKEQKVRSNIDLSSVHLTTMDFGKTNLSLALEVVPTDKIDIDISQYVQLAPMVVPTVGDAKLISRCFFVPYRFIWKYWEDFYSQRAVSSNGVSIGGSVPYFDAHQLTLWFFGDLYNGHAVGKKDYFGFWEVVSSSDAYDFKVTCDNHGEDYFNCYVQLTSKGSQMLQICQALGYNIIPHLGFRHQSSGTWVFDTPTEMHEVFYSFLPLWSLAKVFADYYENPNFNLSNITAIFDSPITTGAKYIAGELGLPTHVYATPFLGPDIFEFIRFCWYENDAFTSAWANPEVSGLSNVFNSQSLSPTPYDVDRYDDTANSAETSGGSINVSNLSFDDNVISQIGLNVLKQLRNFVIRQSAAGGRYIDQLLARYGIRLDSNEARRSQYLGFSVADLKISRVNATAAGSDGAGNISSLGDFTGRGEMAGSGHIHFENNKNDFGMLFVISHIVPDNHYFQGDLPHAMKIDFFDFFNGDMENVSNAPIPYRYLYMDYKDANSAKQNPLDGIFGFSANYLGYKIPFDRLTGDFRLPSRNTELDSFHMFRNLDAPLSGADNAALLQSAFMRFNDKNIESYEKIFNDQSNWSSHFITYFRFKINANRPMNSVMTSLVAQLNEHGNDVGDVVKVRSNGKYF